MTDRRIIIDFPPDVQYDEWRGMVGAHEYTIIIEKATNQLLLDINRTKLIVRRDTGSPVTLPPDTTPPNPSPVTYTWYHTIASSMNVRQEPNLDISPVTPPSPLALNTDLELSPVVTDTLLVQLGFPEMVGKIESGYEWRHIKTGYFIAAKIGTVSKVALGQYQSSGGNTPGSSSPNLQVVAIGNKKGIAIRNSTKVTETRLINQRALAYCGLPRVTGTNSNDIPDLLDKARDFGAKIIRFYTACIDVPDVNARVDRVQSILDQMHTRGLMGILVLNDSIGLSGFNVPGDDTYRMSDNMGHLHYTYFTQKAYRGAYFNHVDALLARVGNHPAIAAWDLMNETGGYGFGSSPITQEATLAIRAFGAETITRIAAKSKHFRSWGIINAAHVGCNNTQQATDFYRGIGLDVISVHLYDERDGWVQEHRATTIDVPAAKNLGLPIWIDEFGAWFEGNNRSAEYQSAIERFKTWAAGFNTWGYNPLSASKNLSDELGFSVHLNDYNSLHSLLRGYMV